MSSIQDRIARLAEQRLALLHQEELAQGQLRKEQKARELRDTDPFQNRNQPHTEAYRKFLADRIAYYIRDVNIFQPNQQQQSFLRYVQQYLKGTDTKAWETRAWFLKTLVSILDNPRYGFQLTGYSEYAIGGKVFTSDRVLYRACCDALGYDPGFSTRHFRDFMDMYLTDQLPKTELDWRLLADPALKTEASYDASQMHPAEATQMSLVQGFGLDGFESVADELVPEAVENLLSS